MIQQLKFNNLRFNNSKSID